MQISIYMPPDLVALVDRHARRSLISRSHFIARAVRDTIEGDPAWPADFFEALSPIAAEHEADVRALADWRPR